MADGTDDRYARQMLVPVIGEEGQRAIAKGTAVIIGLGGLGCTNANILARAGVGTLRLVDRDVVELTNLHRQGLYTEDDAEAKTPKAAAAKKHLEQVNSQIRYESVIEEVDASNIERILAGATVVIDCLDRIQTRALLNEACVKLGLPWVHGACVSTYGEAATFLPGETGCYHCLFPHSASPEVIPETSETIGILGSVAFAVASWQATEAIKILAGRSADACRQLVCFNFWENHIRYIAYARDPHCRVCAERQFTLLQKRDRLI